MKWTKATGYLLIVSPILIQIPYSILITSFEYPAILRLPPALGGHPKSGQTRSPQNRPMGSASGQRIYSPVRPCVSSFVVTA